MFDFEEAINYMILVGGVAGAFLLLFILIRLNIV